MSLEVRKVGQYWAVFDGHQRVSGLFPHSGAVDRMRKIEAQRGHRSRACMCCKARFLSEGPHNRLCLLCRKRDGSGIVTSSGGPTLPRRHG